MFLFLDTDDVRSRFAFSQTDFPLGENDGCRQAPDVGSRECYGEKTAPGFGFRICFPEMYWPCIGLYGVVIPSITVRGTQIALRQTRVK